MKIVHVETLFERGSYTGTAEWKKTRDTIHEAIKAVDWPYDTGQFSIHPVKKANGVVPIKALFGVRLRERNWKAEMPIKLIADLQPGKLDFTQIGTHGLVAVEWETGNISSSHRAMNKLALGLMDGVIAAGVLIVPSKALAPFLTDRIGNYPELKAYLPLWKDIRCEKGILEIVVFEHDVADINAPIIPKGKDGNALKSAFDKI